MYNKLWKWSGIEVVITSYTGTVVVEKSARGFESHSLRQFYIFLKNGINAPGIA